MLLHSTLIYFLAVLGIITGIFTFSIIPKLRKDWLMKIYFIMLGLLNTYTGIIYVLIILGIISAIPPTQSSIFMRPANVMFIVLPYAIANRMMK